MAGRRGKRVLVVCSLVVCAASAGWNAGPPGAVDGTRISGRIVFAEGQVRLAGEAPEGVPIDMSADPYCRDQHDEALLDRSVRVGPDRGVAGVLVQVLNAPAASVPSEAEVVLDQTGCIYTPGAVAVRVGQPLVIRNSDATLHNVRVAPAVNPGFNLGQPIRGIQSTRSFETPEIGIQVRCDIHGWMTASIHVLGHDFFDITGEDGSFTLPTLPPGDYEIEAWHPTLGTVAGHISVTADGAAPLTLEFSSS
ncbi:hypothetical protein [Candidatus Palauibacter sp.]|uniref:hypothetical protein n=1 Tax=Candidatus Palauibacter sp. TaxID=3101350 RepID=UPI003B52B164